MDGVSRRVTPFSPAGSLGLEFVEPCAKHHDLSLETRNLRGRLGALTALGINLGRVDAEVFSERQPPMLR